MTFGALGLVVVGLALLSGQAQDRARAQAPVVASLPYHDTLAYRGQGETLLDLSDFAAPEPIRVERGQTVAGLLATLGLEPAEVYDATTVLAQHIDLRRVRAGEEGSAIFDRNRRLARFELQLKGKGRVELERAGESWEGRWHEVEREVRTRRVEGELTDFLESSLLRAGAMPQLGVAMSLVLQWDLDFNRDLRIGDRFQVLYDEVWIDGERAEVADIQALVYENRNRRLEAYRHGEGGGYYDPEGRPLQKMFLRSPLPFTRVTSRFSHRRFHPVLKIYRPHYGVDYGAPTGTPVRATAAGTVIFAARKRQEGKMVQVRHPNGYVTYYLHLSGFASGIGTGRAVAQGDVIGYVGSTGLSTGAHLDYRVKKNGRWVDPLTLVSRPAPPISEQELPAFLEARDAYRSALVGDSSPVTGSRLAQVDRGREASTNRDRERHSVPPDSAAGR